MIRIKDILKEVEDDLDLSYNPLSKPTLNQYKRRLVPTFEQENPIVELSVGSKAIRGRGDKFRFGTYPDLENYMKKNEVYFSSFHRGKHSEKSSSDLSVGFQNFVQDFLGILQKGGPSNITKELNINWIEYVIIKNLETEDVDNDRTNYFSSYLNPKFAIKGTDDKGREYLCISKYKDFSKPYTLISKDGEISIKHSLKNVQYKNQVLHTLFPNEVQKPTDTSNLNIRQILDITTDQVGFKFDRVIRKGPGIKGDYKKLKNYLTPTSQHNLINVTDSKGITWEDMIIYREGNDTLFSVIGKDPEGQMWMWDRAGHGNGSYSKLRGPQPPNKVNLDY